MKVKVRRKSAKMDALDRLLASPAGQRAMLEIWPQTAQEMPTDMLERILRMHANDELSDISIDIVLILLDEPWSRRINYDPTTPHKLTPSPAGRDCLGNGQWPGYACQCADCDFYEQCFPDWEGHKESV